MSLKRVREGVVGVFGVVLSLVLGAQSLQASMSAMLAGRGFEFSYSNGAVYQVRFDEKELTWTALRGDEAGRSETDPYQVVALTDSLYAVSWKEIDGTFVALTLDLSSARVVSAGTSGDGKYQWQMEGNVKTLPLVSMSQ